MHSVNQGKIPEISSTVEKEANSTIASTKSARFGWRGWLAVVAFYSLLTLLMTWPLALNFGTAVPLGDIEDRYQNFWNFWWVKWALEHFQNPYHSTMLYYPYYPGPAAFQQGSSLPLYFHTLQLLNCLLVLPLTIIGGVAAAYNGVVFGSFVASGVAAFALARYLVKNVPAALLAGVIYAFSGIRFEATHGSWTNILSTEWLPFYILALHCWNDRGKLRYLAGAALALAACAYTDWYNTTYLLLYTTFFFVVTGWPLNWWRQIKRLAPVGIVAFLVASPLLIPSIFELKNPLFITIYDIRKDYRDSTLLSELVSPFSPHGVALWLAVLSGGGILLWQRSKAQWRPLLYWLVFGLGCFVLALGPKVQWERVRGAEPDGPYLPYYLFKKIPAAEIMHSPDRFEIPGTLACGLALAFAVVALRNIFQATKKDEYRFKLLERVKGLDKPVGVALVAVVLGGIALAAVNEAPLTLVPLEHYAFVDTLLQDKSDFHVLELPITRHNNFDYPRMYNQTYYQRPITGGYLSRPIFDPYRDPASPFRYLADQSYVYGPDPNKEIFPAAYTLNQLDQVVKLSHFDYVVIYKEDYKNPKEISELKRLLDSRLGAANVVQEDARTLTYKTPAGFWQKPVGPALALGEGWYGVEQNAAGYYHWTQAAADFYLTVEKSGPVKLRLKLAGFGGDLEAKLTLEGKPIFQGRVTPEPQEIELEFEAKAGTNRLRLESLSPVATPQQLGQGQDNRPLAFLVQNLSIEEKTK